MALSSKDAPGAGKSANSPTGDQQTPVADQQTPPDSALAATETADTSALDARGEADLSPAERGLTPGQRVHTPDGVGAILSVDADHEGGKTHCVQLDPGAVPDEQVRQVLMGPAEPDAMREAEAKRFGWYSPDDLHR